MLRNADYNILLTKNLRNGLAQKPENCALKDLFYKLKV